MAHQIKIYIDDDAYEAMTIECKKRGIKQGKLITESLRQMLLNESTEQEQTVILAGLLQAHAKLDCLLHTAGITEAEVEARLYPNEKPITPEQLYSVTPENGTVMPGPLSTPHVEDQIPVAFRKKPGRLKRLFFSE